MSLATNFEKRTERILLPTLLRIGEGLARAIRDRAAANDRSIQMEIVYLLKAGVKANPLVEVEHDEPQIDESEEIVPTGIQHQAAQFRGLIERIVEEKLQIVQKQSPEPLVGSREIETVPKLKWNGQSALPVEYLTSISTEGLRGFELMQMNRAANLEKEIKAMDRERVRATALAETVRLLIENRSELLRHSGDDLERVQGRRI